MQCSQLNSKVIKCHSKKLMFTSACLFTIGNILFSYNTASNNYDVCSEKGAVIVFLQ